MKREHAAGVLIFIGTFVFLVAMIVAEAKYPNYSIANNYISDLGVGSTAYIFNSTIILFGVLLIIGAVLIASNQRKSVFPYLLIIAAIGAIMVGTFPENTGSLHSVGAYITFLFAAIAAIVGVSWIKSPFRFLSLAAGLFIAAAIFLYIEKMYLGIGVGGMERMIVDPALFWGLGLSSYLMGMPDTKK